ncbi:hypothetical protein SO802_022581 [Lithocarpus litseifolius]|uniref:Aminotransferase-like plant mobile domain-containing protein n=1 Tax=Lithocarpus litseifolius TaxID=425828 RepID=A0AAW2C5A1_9ROSI
MDPHQQRPSIRDVLTRQDVHCSSLLWDAPLADKDAGLDGLLRVPNIDVGHVLITALVERWRPEMHSFHLPHGEMTITLQDMEVIIGVPVVGLPVVGFTRMDKWGDLCAELLGHRPPNREIGADATEMFMQQYARFYMLEMLAEKTAKPIGGAVLLVQLWAWVRFPHICPVMRHPHQALPPGPLTIRYKGAKRTTEHPTHVLCAYRVSLASLRPNQIFWEPYQNDLRSLPAYCTTGQHIWRSIVSLIHFWVIKGHHPKCVLQQFGMKQGIPEDVDTSIELHKITL